MAMMGEDIGGKTIIKPAVVGRNLSNSWTTSSNSVCAKHSARVSRISRLQYRVSRSQGQVRGHRSLRLRSSPPLVRPNLIFSDIVFSRSDMVYSARVMQQPVTLFGETDAFFFPTLRLLCTIFLLITSDIFRQSYAATGHFVWRNRRSTLRSSRARDI